MRHVAIKTTPICCLCERKFDKTIFALMRKYFDINFEIL